MKYTWEFKPRQQGTVAREATEDEHFAAESEDGADSGGYGRIDALVREAIQNSLDARVSMLEGSRPVEVRFRLRRGAHGLQSDKAAWYLEGLPVHLKAANIPRIIPGAPIPTMDYLVIEDFGTTGLLGDPARGRRPQPLQQENWYWFWWHIGASGKSGGRLGRWGLGRTVFAAASDIRAFFAFTERTTDRQTYFMGQARILAHEIDEQDLLPDGFFFDAATHTSPVWQPISEPVAIERVRMDFGLRQRGEAGLSIIIPYAAEGISREDLARSVLRHWFVPIAEEELQVRIDDGTGDPYFINRLSMRAVLQAVQATDRRRRRVTVPSERLLSLSGNSRREPASLIEIDARSCQPLEWSRSLLPDTLLERMKAALASSGQLGVRIHLTVELRDEGSTGVHSVDSCFDVYLEQDQSLSHGHDWWVRSGMTINQLSSLRSRPGLCGIVRVEHPVLGKLLGDAEGPAHENWKTTETRPDREYLNWKSRVRFVRRSLEYLAEALSAVSSEVQEDLLATVFSVPSLTAKHGGHRRRSRLEAPPAPPPPPPPPSPRTHRIGKLDSGFEIAGAGTGEEALRPLRVRVAYDVPAGSPFKSYHPIDFDFRRSGRFVVTAAGAEFRIAGPNELHVRPRTHDFSLRVTGFDTSRGDLVVSTTEGVDVAPEDSQ